MIWFICLYLIPALFILMLALPAKNMVSKNVLTVLYVTAFFPVFNLLVMVGVIYNLCTIKDFNPYTNDAAVEQQLKELEELGKQLNELFNKDK